MSWFDLFRSKPPAPPLIEVPTLQTVTRVIERDPEPTWQRAKEMYGIERDLYPAGEWSDLTYDWGISTPTAYQVIHQNLTNLRARARQEHRKNDYAKRFVNMMQNGVIGPHGFTLRTQFKNTDGTRDTVAGSAFESHWRKWANDKTACDVRRQQNFAQICRLLLAQFCTDGEILIRRWERGPMGYQLQVIDPVVLDVTYNDLSTTGNRIRFGVEVDQFGAPVAYYLNKETDFHYYTGERERVPAAQIYHVFLHEMVDQFRGIPWLATPSYRMHMLDGFEEASLVNARAGASKMGFRKRNEPERFQGDDEEGRGVREVDTYAPGLIDELGADETFESFDPTYPQGEFKDYVRQVLKGVASGLLVSYPTLANDLEGVNYTSLRHDALQERDVYMGLQTWLCDHLLKPIYDDWLMFQMGQPEGIPIPRTGGGTRRASGAKVQKFREVKFQGRRWQWVDPAKEVKAQADAVELGITTREQIIIDNGGDPEEVLANVEDERKRFGSSERTPNANAQPDNRTEGDQSEDEND